MRDLQFTFKFDSLAMDSDVIINYTYLINYKIINELQNIFQF